MYLGCNEIDITPNIPIQLAGYMLRKKPATGVASRLFARSFVFRQNDLTLGLITADLLMLSQKQSQWVRREAGRLTGIDPDNIIVACTHTHAGPTTDTVLGNPPDPVYVQWVLKALAGSLYQAANDLEKVEAGYLVSEVEGISANRRDPDGEVDRRLIVLGFQTEAEDLKGLLFNFACHPTVMGPDNLLVSPEYPGHAVEFLKNAFPGTTVGFLNGAAGDVSTRFVRREQTHKESRRLGRILGASVAGLAEKLTFGPVELDAKEVSFPILAKELVDDSEAEQEIAKWEERLAELKSKGASAGELRVAQTGLEGALVQREAKNRAKLPKESALCAWRFGDLGLVSIPGELFTSLGKLIRANAPFPNVIISCYSNGVLGYIPSQEAYEQGGYEALSSPLAPGFGEKLAAAAVDALKELAEAR